MIDPADQPRGLSSEEALGRLASAGPNELSSARRKTFLRAVLEVVKEPMVLLLIACSALYFSFGDLKEAILLAASIGLVIGITLVQERKTERALEALKNLSSPRASVIRDGRAVRIPAREVVPGDLLLLEEGDRVSADAVLLRASGVRVDESLLTGESVAVKKTASATAIAMQAPGVEGSPFVYASTLVTSGRGQAQVQATGSATEVGKIGRALETLSAGESPLHKQISGLVRALGVLAAVVCVAVFLIYGLGRSEWRQGLLAGLTLAMSLLPEEFPVVMTLFLVLGAYRMSKNKVLARRLAALETLGAATVLCTDKTGTLTENKLKVVKWVAAGPDEQELAAIAALACPPHSFDPVDLAALQFGSAAIGPGLPPQQPVLREYPLKPELPVLAEARRYAGRVLIALKGGPEAVASLCRLDEDGHARLRAQTETLAAAGLKTLAVAKAVVHGPPPERLTDAPFELLGVIGLEDPLRDGVRAAVDECRDAGIRVMMITGDHPQTALAIARQAGIDANECLTGAEVAQLDDASLTRRLETACVFARVTPMHKLRLVERLRARGEVVAMTGDGVNDAPALKASHIGVAMGGRGTDVAREAADLVVLDDNFVSIVGAIRAGRRIYANLQKSLGYVLAVHVPIAGMGLLPLLLGWPLLFTPIHIVFLELIIDPACSIAFELERAEADLMKRPPRSRDARLLGLPEISRSLVEGGFVLVAMLITFWAGLQRHAGPADARAISFTTLILGNLSLILMNRSRTRSLWQTLRAPNPAWWAILFGAIGVLALSLYVPALRSLFQFSFLHVSDLLLCLAATAGLFVSLALVRLARGKGRGDSAGSTRLSGAGA